MSLEEIISEISKNSDLSEEEVKGKIKEKQVELSGLVSAEGAAYIVGKEIGVKLLKKSGSRKLKIENIVPGMRSVELTCKIVNLSEKRDFEKNGKKGSVLNVILGDETGTVRMSLWNDEINKFMSMGFKEGDVIEIKDAYVKENSLGNGELSMGRSGKITKSENKMDDVKYGTQPSRSMKNCEISELMEGDYGEVRGSLVKIFKRTPFFEVCPECGSRLEKDGDSWRCKEHEKIDKPLHNMALSGVLDDGTGNIRVVFFRDAAEKLLGMSTEEAMSALSDNEDALRSVSEGKEIHASGRVKRNNFNDNIEMVVNEMEDVDGAEVAKAIAEELGKD